MHMHNSYTGTAATAGAAVDKEAAGCVVATSRNVTAASVLLGLKKETTAESNFISPESIFGASLAALCLER